MKRKIKSGVLLSKSISKSNLIFKATLLILIFFPVNVLAFGQNQQINLRTEGQTLEEVLLNIEKISGYSFVYPIEDVKDLKGGVSRTE